MGAAPTSSSVAHRQPQGGISMGTWKFDPYHTKVEFSAKHLGMMTVRGHFAEVTATGDIYPDQPEKSTTEMEALLSLSRTASATANATSPRQAARMFTARLKAL